MPQRLNLFISKTKEKLTEGAKRAMARSRSSSPSLAGPQGSSDHSEDDGGEVDQSPPKIPKQAVPPGEKENNEVSDDSTDELNQPFPERNRQHNSSANTKTQETTKLAKASKSQKSVNQQPNHEAQGNDQDLEAKLQEREAEILRLRADKQTSEAETKASKAEIRRLKTENNQLKRKEASLENTIEAIAALILPNGHSNKAHEVEHGIRSIFTKLQEDNARLKIASSDDPSSLIRGLFNIASAKPDVVPNVTPKDTMSFVASMSFLLKGIVQKFDPIDHVLYDGNFAPCEELKKAIATVTCSSTGYDLEKAKRVSRYYREIHFTHAENNLLIAVSSYFAVDWTMDKSFPPTELFSNFVALKKYMQRRKLGECH